MCFACPSRSPFSWASAVSSFVTIVRQRATSFTNASSAFRSPSHFTPAASVDATASAMIVWCSRAAGRMWVRATEAIVSPSINSCLTYFSTAM